MNFKKCILKLYDMVVIDFLLMSEKAKCNLERFCQINQFARFVFTFSFSSLILNRVTITGLSFFDTILLSQQLSLQFLQPQTLLCTFNTNSSLQVLNRTFPQPHRVSVKLWKVCVCTKLIVLHSLYITFIIYKLYRTNLRMEKQEIKGLVHDFDQFVKLSLQKKVQVQQNHQQQQTQAQTYLTAMEKRLKLIPITQNQKFQNILKPMKQLKSFVSVREFMQKLGSDVMGRIEDKSKMNVEEQKMRLQYQTLRGGYYLQKIEQHLRRMQFKRKACDIPLSFVEQDGNPHESSEFKNWVESTLSKISPKCETFFKQQPHQAINNQSQQQNSNSQQQNCLIQEHMQNYSQQYKIVPRIRQVGNQEYERFAQISNLLTSRLKRILKSNCCPRTTICSQPQKSNLFNKQRRKNSYRNTLRVMDKNSGFQINQRKDQSKRIQTSGNCQREELNYWRKSVNCKIKHILNNY